MKKRCEICQEPFVVGDDDLAFLLKLAPKFHGKNYPFPEPQSCPNCRLRARLSFRNQIYVYSRKSSKSGEQVFSMYPDDSPFPVYAHDEWWSDSWDAADYGQEFDFSRPFFAQFAALAQQVPSFPLSVLKCENSSYSNHCTSVRNCYLVFNTSNAEDCMYCENAFGSRDCTDCTHTPYSELCYDCIQCGRCYALQSSICCEHCSDSYFLFNCTGCRNCFGCVNLRRAEYRIFNEQKTRDEYHAFISSLPLDSFAERSRLRRQCEEFFRLHPRPHIDSKMTEHVTGNLIFEAKNVFDSCLVRGAENCKYVYNAVHGVKDCYDFSCFGNGAELLYACVSCGSQAYNLRCCCLCWGGVYDLNYCWMCSSSRDCFGCVGLRNKSNMILNKQYSPAEYQHLAARIAEHMRETGEWGKFFPMRISPVPYNSSLAQRVFPRSAEDVRKEGLRWYEKETLSRAEAVGAADLPDRLPQTDRAFTVSGRSGRLFRITSEEVRRYRKLNVPLPRDAYDERMEQRALWLGGLKLYPQRCAKTGQPILSTIRPGSGWIVWEREVYEKEFAG